MNRTIQQRFRMEVNTDPQRRCYNGCHFSSELVWTSWKNLECIPEERASERLEFWKSLNVYAVSQRGKSALREFRIAEVASKSTNN